VETKKEIELINQKEGKERTISVFGPTGFVGSHFTQKSRFKAIPIARHNLTSQSREILYLVGTVHNYNVFTDVNVDIDTNLKVLVNTLEASRNIYPDLVFNFVSSWFVYGPGEIPFREDQPCNPKGFYSITKYAAELLLRSYCETYSLNYRIIRLGNVLGPGDSKTSAKKNAVQFMANMIRNGEDINLYEGGNVLRDFIHVDDVVLGLDLILEKAPMNQIFNLASGVGLRVGKLLHEFKTLTGSKSVLHQIETPKFHNLVQAKDSILDISKVKELGFNITRPITERELLV